MNFLDQMRQDASNSGTIYIHKLQKFKPPTEDWKAGFRPSSLAYKFCPRLTAMLELGLVRGTKKIPPRLQRIFDVGHAVHDRHHNYTQKLDVLYVDERYGDPKKGYACEEISVASKLIKMKGTYDCIIDGKKLRGDEYLYVTDFKSIRTEDFSNLVEVPDKHYRQIVAYMGMITENYELDRPIKGMYIYEDKNDQRLKEFQVPWDDDAKEFYAELIELVKLSNEAAATGDLDKVPCLCRNNDPCRNWDIEELKRNPKDISL